MARRRKRRKRRTKKNSKMRNITYAFLLILLVIFFATVGLQLVIRASLFISGITDDEIVTEETDQSFLIAPELYDVPDATNSAEIRVSGSGTQGTELSIFVNDNEEEVMTLDNEDFETTLNLELGSNTIYLQTHDEENNRIKDSEIYTVIYSNAQPNFTIEEPSDNSTVNDQEVTVQGVTEEDIAIRINGLPTVLRADGTFQRTVRLNEGDNIITIEAENAAGNIEEKEITVRYEDD